MQRSTGAADAAGPWPADGEWEDHVAKVDASVTMPRVLADLAEGRLNREETDAVVVWLQASAPEPPPWVVNRAVRIARPAAAGRRAGPTIWRRLVASLVSDNRLRVGPAGARAARAEQLRLLYQAGGIEIDLEVTDSSIAGRLRMLGQVTAHAADLTGAWAIAEGPAGRTEAGVDELGQFALDGLLPGRHRLEIGLACELIEIPELQI